MWERYQSWSRSIKEKVAPVLAIPLTAGVAMDLWSHPIPNNQVGLLSHLLRGTEADLARRATIASIPEIGEVLSTHIGNFGYSAALMIPISAIGSIVKEYGRSKENRIVETVGDIIPFVGFIGIVAINLVAEGMASNDSQFWGDLLFGLGGTVTAQIVTQGTLSRFITKRNQRLAADNFVIS